jgi:hypothetical protein
LTTNSEKTREKWRRTAKSQLIPPPLLLCVFAPFSLVLAETDENGFFHGMQEVNGSILLSSTRRKPWIGRLFRLVSPGHKAALDAQCGLCADFSTSFCWSGDKRVMYWAPLSSGGRLRGAGTIASRQADGQYADHDDATTRWGCSRGAVRIIASTSR